MFRVLKIDKNLEKSLQKNNETVEKKNNISFIK